MRNYFFFAPMLFLTACSCVKSSFTPEIQIVTERKENYSEVAYLTKKPLRTALKIGSLSVNGDGSANFDDLIVEAKKKAAELGGDFILEENSGVETSQQYSPAYTKYEADASTTDSGQGTAKTNSYSVGPRVTSINRPWGVFSVWVYVHAQLGVRLDENNVISSFHLNSDAQQAGIQIGDRVIGIDDYDVNDEEFYHHLMKIYPKDKVKLTLLRNSTKIESQITALRN